MEISTAAESSVIAQALQNRIHHDIKTEKRRTVSYLTRQRWNEVYVGASILQTAPWTSGAAAERDYNETNKKKNVALDVDARNLQIR